MASLPPIVVTDFDEALAPLYQLERSLALPTLDREAFLDLFFDELNARRIQSSPICSGDWNGFAEDLIEKGYLYERAYFYPTIKDGIILQLARTSARLQLALLKYGMIQYGDMQYVYDGQIGNELYQFVIRSDASVSAIGCGGGAPPF